MLSDFSFTTCPPCPSTSYISMCVHIGSTADISIHRTRYFTIRSQVYPQKLSFANTIGMLTSYASGSGAPTRGIALAHVEQSGMLHRPHISPGKCGPPHVRTSSGQQSSITCGCRTLSTLSLCFHSQLSLSSCSSGNWTSIQSSLQYRSLYCDKDK